MISFKILTEAAREELLDEIEERTPGADFHLAEDNLDAFLAKDDGVEYAVGHSHGCMLFRVFDGEYSFLYPLPLRFDADMTSAAAEIRAYAVKEEIPLVFLDVPVEELSNLLPTFRHANIDAADEENRYFTVRVMSEAALLGELPTCEGDRGVDLTPLTEADDEIYARLCKDEDTNRYWGFDYIEDEPNPTDSYFRENAESEFYRGVSICLAVRVNEVFAGEAILYAFDLLGGCECAVRLLPAFRRKGYATESLDMLKELARNMGMLYLYATVAAENKASVHLTRKCLSEVYSDGKIVKFKEKL